MSMLQRYKELTDLKGSSLGFFNFFKKFKSSRTEPFKSIIWEGVNLIGEPHYSDFMEYIQEQMFWIDDFRTQERIQNGHGRSIFFESKKRLQFFILELEKHIHSQSAYILSEIIKESKRCLNTTDPIPTRSDRPRYYESSRERSRSRERIPPPISIRKLEPAHPSRCTNYGIAFIDRNPTPMTRNPPLVSAPPLPEEEGEIKL